MSSSITRLYSARKAHDMGALSLFSSDLGGHLSIPEAPYVLSRSLFPSTPPTCTFVVEGRDKSTWKEGVRSSKSQERSARPVVLALVVSLPCPVLAWSGQSRPHALDAVLRSNPRMHRAFRITSSRFLLFFCLLATCLPVSFTLHWPLFLANVVSAAVHRSFTH